MIRINLLSVERERTKKRAAGSFQTVQKMTIGCSLILVLAAVFIGWRYLTLTRDSRNVDDEIGRAQQEAGRLHSIIQQVQQFEQRKAQLSQRVQLIEQLRKGQTGPVHMLDEISRSMPAMLWLTDLKQTASGDVTIEGRCTMLTSLSDFVANLESSGYFRKSIEIVNSQTEQTAPPAADVIKFTIKASFQVPGEAPAAPAGRIPGASAIPGAAAKKGG